MIWKPHVTVAAIVESSGRFLCVEEQIDGELKLNQPAGHLEPGEDLLAAVIREMREETTREFTPRSIVGIYLWRHSDNDSTFLRVTFAGTASEPDPRLTLDPEIRDVVWVTADEIRARQPQWRSPLVMRCVQDYLSGQRYPLAILQNLLDQA